MSKRRADKETMLLLYQKTGSRLYGHIRFYRHHVSGKAAPTMLKESRPFVIGETVPGLDRLKVFGSVEFLVGEIRRLIDEFIDYNHKWWASREKISDVQVDFDYHRHVMDFVILTSTHTRNLIHIIKRLNGNEITKFNYEGRPDGKVKLSELFDILIHNRYYYFDGTNIRDIFSDKTTKASPLSKHFMGYGIALNDFINAVLELITDVSIRDLSQLLRWKFKTLNSTSSPQDVVFLIQNLHSFSHMMQTKIPKAGYNFMMNLMFNGVDLASIVDETGSRVRLVFQSPNIAINSDLTKRAFKISVRYADAAGGVDMAGNNLKSHSIDVPYTAFFDQVNAAFGDDKLLQEQKITVIPGND